MSSPFGSMSLNSLMFNVETRSPSSVRTFHERTLISKHHSFRDIYQFHLKTQYMFSFIGILVSAAFLSEIILSKVCLFKKHRRNSLSDRHQMPILISVITEITDAESELRIQTYLKTRAHPQMTSLFRREIWVFKSKRKLRDFWNLELLSGCFIYI